MLLLEHLVAPLELPKPSQLCRGLHIQLGRSGHDHPFANLLSPQRQHERMNVQCGRNILHLHPWQAAQLHGSRLESISVFLNLARTCLCHNTPPAVRPRCQLNRGKLGVGQQPAVRLQSHWSPLSSFAASKVNSAFGHNTKPFLTEKTYGSGRSPRVKVNSLTPNSW